MGISLVGKTPVFDTGIGEFESPIPCQIKEVLMNLGYCVVFNHGEQGYDMPVVVVTSASLERAISLVENISGYPRDHERYDFDIFDLTKLYHQKALGEGQKLLKTLKDFSPEAVHAIETVAPVKLSVQAFPMLEDRDWINRKYDVVVKHLYDHLRKLTK